MNTNTPHNRPAPGGDREAFRLTAVDCLHPRNLPLWSALGILRLLTLLPYPWQMRLGRGLGGLIFHVLRGRRAVAATNIRLAFPDKSGNERRHMVRQHFAGLGMSLFETGITWWRSPRWYLPRISIEGREHLDHALAQGRGALLLTPHYTALELAGIGAGQQLGLCATYAEPKNPLVEKLLIGHRKRLLDIVLHNSDIRGMVRTLRANRALFFAPDQTMRRTRGSVIAPFFGIPVVTSTGTSRLARMSRAPVITMLLLRREDHSGYRVRFLPALENFPTADAEADTARVNEHLAEQIRAHAPEQYFWIHQRFKRGRTKHERIPYVEPLPRPPRVYRLINLALALPMSWHVRRRAARDGGHDYHAQRHGHSLDALPRRAIWIHAASVGEVAAALPLLAQLARERDEPLLLSTNTPTGHAVARARAPTGTAICYLPIDRPTATRRFVHKLEPKVALIMETELWPWLYAHLRHAAVPIVIVNGRLSARTRNAPRWLQPALRFCLKQCRLVLARSDDDADAFRALGGPRRRTRTIGNLKYAPGAQPAEPVHTGRTSVLAASTHTDEELQLARAWQHAATADALLIIAPRHPERGDDIEAALRAEGIDMARRSRGDAVTANTEIYLADTMGELTALMAGAEVVIMGGSFVPHGGQNLLEPARLGRATVVGPHMDNFRAETERLAAVDGIAQCTDAASAIDTCVQLLADPDARSAMGARAQATLAAEDDVVARYRDAIEVVLEEASALRRPAS